MFQWDGEEDEGDTRERVTLGYHEEGEIKVEGKQVTFFLCCHQSIEMIKEENVLRRGSKGMTTWLDLVENIILTWSGSVCVCGCVYGSLKKIQIQQVERDRRWPSCSVKLNLILKCFECCLKKVK